MRETQVQSLGQEDFLEKEMETHSSILAWEIPWTEEPARLVYWVIKSQTQLSFLSFLTMSIRVWIVYKLSKMDIGGTYNTKKMIFK